ncbi:MAG: hypothetical protein K9G44_02410, partial [Melioribacteraceae bacterium]|nr:hypothetical protein [Melioribacteraceae bacterium]
KLILATIDTGLFVLNGSDKYSWAHQTFAEYLCASYVYEKGLQDEQILNLFFQFDGDKQIAIPQLEESIGWLLSIKPDLIAKVFNENLTLMFKCDILFQQNDLKRTLFFSLLNGVNSSEIFYPRHRLIKQYHKLSFPDISKLIIEFVEDSTKSIQTKIEAICIGNQCGLVELKDFYCNQLNTFSMPAILRTVILDAHYLHNDRDFIEAVKNTLYNYLSDDDNDQLKGDCLSLLYPQHLNFGEIIHLLRPRKNTRYIGSYVVFLGGINLGKADLNMGEILIGLKWVQKLGAKNIVSNYHLDDIVDGIMIEALEFLDDESILNSYADAVVALVNNHSNIVEQKNKDRFIKKLSETNSRKRLIELLINKMINPQVNIWSLTSHRTRLVNKSDFLWLLEKGTNECRLEYKEAFYNLCHRLFDEENSEQREIMLALAEEDELLKVVFKSLLQPIELNGKDANDAKKIYKESHSFSYYGKSRLSYLSHKERLLYHIDLLKSDSKSAVWRLIYFISYDHVNDELFGELNPILENHPGWKNLNHEEIDLLLRKGKTYLLEQESNSKKWFGKNQYNRVDYAAYKLLLYFHRFENDYFNQLQINVLKKWIPVLITFPLQGSDDNAIDSQKKLIVEIHQKIPKIFEELFEKILDSELDRNESLTCLKFYEQCWNDKYSELLLKKLSITLKPSSFNSIIGFLGKQAPNYLIKYFSELTKKNIPSESDQLENFISGISLNAKIKSEEVIEYLGHNKNINRELTRKILIRIAQRDDYNSDFFNNASIQVFVELYLIIAELFTKEELERTENDFASYVSPYDKLNDFKTNLLMTIRERKTAESIGALELLVKNYPAESMFKEILYDTKVLVRYNAWKPNDIPELKEFLKNDKKRLVSNEDELLSEIIASLKRLEAKMHGTPPQVRQLWSEKKINIPKDESTLSDMLQFHLKEDLKSIVVNAEVVIDRFNRTKKGKQVDLIVDAISDKYEQISVIVEVKGSWNPKLHESMKTQLKERYLKERPYRFGLYLVGWYLCDEWQRFKENDNRFRQNKKKTIEVVIEEMERQAQSLSDKNCAIKSFVLDCRYNR